MDLRALVLFLPLAREDLAIDDGAFDSRRAVERRVFHVAGLFAENRTQQLLFRRKLRLAFRSDLAHQNVARFHRGADADDPAFVQVPQEVSAMLGMSRVISSGPSLVSRASISNSSMWIEV